MSESDSSLSDTQSLPLRLGRCEVCAAQPARYTCPKCELKTCSLPCVGIHKRELPCDGIRDRTKFVRVEDFTDSHLLSDYRMLEETALMIYGKRRNEEKRFTRIDRDLPFMMHLMKKAASNRGTVLLYTMHHFTRRLQNTTHYARKEDKIDWRVEWVFPNADPQSVKFADVRCPEDTKLADLLDKYLDPAYEKFDGSNSLIYYHSAGHNGVKALLKAERVAGCSRKYHELDLDLSLKENLCGKCIVEFPTIFVLFKDHTYGLEIIDSDCESDHEDTGQKNVEPAAANQHYWKPRQLLTTRIAIEKKKAIAKEIAQDKRKKPKNLLFTTGYSSEEDVSGDDAKSEAKKGRLDGSLKF